MCLARKVCLPVLLWVCLGVVVFLSLCVSPKCWGGSVYVIVFVCVSSYLCVCISSVWCESMGVGLRVLVGLWL